MGDGRPQDRPAAVGTAQEVLELEARGGARAASGGRLAGVAGRAASPFRRPQAAIDQLLLDAIVQVNDETRRALAEGIDALLSELTSANERLEQELERVTSRVAALEASLALISERLGQAGLDERGADDAGG